jgi:hypothetical protein
MACLLAAVVGASGSAAFAQEAPEEGGEASVGGAEGAAPVDADAEAQEFLAGGTAEEAAEGDASESPTGDESADRFLAGENDAPLIEAPAEEEGTGWEEPEDMRFYMVGARWRLLMIPRWLLGAFFSFPSESSGQQLPATVTVNQSAGLEFSTRRNNFNIVAGVWWAGYFSQSDYADDLGDGWFIAEEAGSSDDPEFIRSRIHLLMFTVDFLYSPMFTEWFGIYVGGGLGLGVNLAGSDGGLDRDEAIGPSGGPYDRCGTPTGGVCESDGFYYPATEDDIWPVYPWINILVGLRFKVFRHLEINVDGGVGLGFMFGARVNYIF